MSFVQVSVFPGRQLGDYVPNHVARTKILVAIAPKVVAAWRVASFPYRRKNNSSVTNI